MSDINLKKREIVLTTNTRGWFYLRELAEKTIQQMERDAIDEDDEARGSLLRRQAKSARVFFTNFLGEIESMRRFDAPAPEEGDREQTTSDDFYEVALD